MPDRHRILLARTLVARAALATAAVAVLALGGTAGAQEDEEEPDPRWAGSTFAEPFDDGEQTVTEDLVTVEGEFFLVKEQPGDRIAKATVTLADDPDDEFELAEACELPEPVEVPGDEPDPTVETDLLVFRAEDLVFVCNGRYLVRALAETDDPELSHELTATLDVVVPPEPARDLTAEVQSDGRVVLRWAPPEAIYSDFAGFRVERAGPRGDDGSYGSYAAITADLTVTQFTDEPADGTYAYRVRALRAGPQGRVPANAQDSPTAFAGVTGSVVTTTTTRARAGIGLPRPRSTRPPQPLPSIGAGRTTATTRDTGFGEIDYGELPEFGTEEATDVPELGPEEGQSILRNAEDGSDMWAPIAGGLVLAGWAAHLLYLNRLAKHI